MVSETMTKTTFSMIQHILRFFKSCRVKKKSLRNIPHYKNITIKTFSGYYLTTPPATETELVIMNSEQLSTITLQK